MSKFPSVLVVTTASASATGSPPVVKDSSLISLVSSSVVLSSLPPLMISCIWLLSEHIASPSPKLPSVGIANTPIPFVKVSSYSPVFKIIYNVGVMTMNKIKNMQ